MIKKILIFGSGSIGNHMSFASRQLGYQVFITDINYDALVRMKNIIYPKRYKKWDDKIIIVNFKKVFYLKEKFDLIVIGTPPNSHLNLYRKCIKNINFKKILIEKPLLNYKENLDSQKFLSKDIQVFCGYNHSISKSFIFFLKNLKILKGKKIIKVNWKEGWNGILNAHFWMKNEFSSYLGNLKEGGGSLHEHSHGLHLLYIILKKLKINLDKSRFSSNILFKIKGSKCYDEYSSLIGKKKKTTFIYETDLISVPAEKSIIASDNQQKRVKLIFNYKKNSDAVITINNNKKHVKFFKKTRSSEFENELKYIISLKKDDYNKSYINVFNAISVIKIIKNVLEQNGK